MESTLNHYINEIINNESKLVRVRYALFLGYLVDMLYKDKDEAFKQGNIRTWPCQEEDGPHQEKDKAAHK